MNNLKENYRHNIIGSLMGAFVVAVAGYFATYLKLLGGNDYHFAMLNAMPSMVAVLALIPGAMIIDGTKNKLKSVLLIGFFSRAFYLTFALVPLLPKPLQPLVFVLLVGCRNAPESVWLIGYQSIMADVFPMEALNEIIGKRNKYNSILSIGSTFLLGAFLSLNEKFAIESIVLFQLLFAFTFFIGLLEMWEYSKFDFEQKPIISNEKFSKRFLGVIKTLPQHPKYLIYCSTILVYYLGWQMAWPLYNLYQLNVLNASPAWVGYIQISSQLIQVLTIGLWIKLSKKIGSKFVLGICMFLMTLSPCVYALSTTLPLLLIAQIIVGSGTGGTVFLVFNELLYVCPEKNRTLYISLFTCITQITGSIMPFFGTFIKQSYSIYTALYFSAVLRLVGAIVFFLGCKALQKFENKIGK